MSAPCVSLAPGLEPSAYFAHRTATGRTAELLVGSDLEILWVNAAALSLAAGSGAYVFASGRLILPLRQQEEAFQAFLDALEGPGAWHLKSGAGRWLVRAEPIAPPQRPRAYLLTLHAMSAEERYLWADLAAATGLTPSEARIVKLLIEGLRLDEAAQRLGIAIQTARTHIRRSYHKLGVSSREEMFSRILEYRLG
jgi:DNA-binding CsgD family transcriptional regulator